MVLTPIFRASFEPQNQMTIDTLNFDCAKQIWKLGMKKLNWLTVSLLNGGLSEDSSAAEKNV